MSITHDWVVACQTALVDRLTNKISLIHILEQFQVAKFPAVLPPFQIVALWHNRVDMAVSAKLRIEVEELAGDSASLLSEEEVVFAGRVSHRSICIVHAMTVLRPGAYRIVARFQEQDSALWQEGNSHPFSLTAAGNPPSAAQA